MVVAFCRGFTRIIEPREEQIREATGQDKMSSVTQETNRSLHYKYFLSKIEAATTCMHSIYTLSIKSFSKPIST